MTALTIPTIWWIACGAAVALELTTGSLYLLLIGGGLAAGAIAAHAGAVAAVQLLVAAAVGGVGTLAWHRIRASRPAALPARENADVNQDIGAVVQVPDWSADRSARIVHRGAEWTARLRGDGPALPGRHRVAAVEGNWLVLEPLASS